jgi:hypothetical protein
VDNAFFDAGRISELTKVVDATTNVFLKNLLLAKLNALKLREAELSSEPPTVAELEGVMKSEIAALQDTQRKLKLILETVRAQNALMKVVATTIDAWLDTDVTITKAQADNLETAIITSQKAIGGGK